MAVFDVKRFGAEAGSNEDSAPAIRRAIAAAMETGGPAEVVLGEGFYKILPSGAAQPCFRIDGARGLTIRGMGDKTRLIAGEPSSDVFRFGKCVETFIKDLSIDFDPVPYAQGRIADKSDAQSWIDLDIQPGFPLLSEPCFANTRRPYGRWGMIFDKQERRLKDGAPDCVFVERWEAVRDRVFRLYADTARGAAHTFAEVGDRFVHLARTSGSVIGFFECKNCGIEDATVYAGPTLASLVVGSEGMSIRRFAVRHLEGSERLLTMDADGIHCAANRQGPLIEDCFFEGMADDSINIYCPPNVVLQVVSPREAVVNGRTPIRPGDRLQIMNPRAGEIVAEVGAASVEPCAQGWRLIFDAPVEGVQGGKDHREADTIYNLSASGEGYAIRNNRMRQHRRHGMLLRAGKGLVEGNTIENVCGLGIVVTNEPDWPEGPFADGIVIRGNRIVAPGACRGYADSPMGGAIQIKGTKLGHGVSDGRSQRRIVLENNTIVDPRGTAIFLGGAEDVRLSGNRIESTGRIERRREGGAVVLDNCRAVAIEDLTVNDIRPGTLAAVEIRANVETGAGGVALGAIKAQLSESAQAVLDLRGKPMIPQVP